MKGSDELDERILFEGQQLLEQVQQFSRHAALAELEAREQGRELDIESAYEFSQSQQRRREASVLEASDCVRRDTSDFGERTSWVMPRLRRRLRTCWPNCRSNCRS
jgi:hypothetical protein